MQLGMQKVVEQIDGVTLWTDAVDEGMDERLSETFDCKVYHQQRPAPVLPLQNSTLLPTDVALDRIEARKRQKIKNMLMVAGLRQLRALCSQPLAGFALRLNQLIEKAEAFADSGEVEERAEQAREAVDGPEGDSLRDAEEKGKDRSREEDDPKLKR